MEIAAHRAARDLESGGGARKILLVFAKDVFDMRADDFFKLIGNLDIENVIRGQRQQARIHRTVILDKTPEIRFIQYRRAFEQIQELPHVARIGVGLQRGNLRLGKMFAETPDRPGVGECADIFKVLT